MKNKLFLVSICYLITLSILSCKNEKNELTAEVHMVDISSSIGETLLSNGAFTLTIPGIGAKSVIDTNDLYMGRDMYVGNYTYSEDQGTIYLDHEKLQIISKVTNSRDSFYYAMPVYIKPKLRTQTMSFITYFVYDKVSLSHKQLQGGVWLEKGASDLILEDEIQAVKYTYTLDSTTIDRRLFARSGGLKHDYAYGVNQFLERSYFVEDDGQSDEDIQLEYAFGGFDLDSDGRDEVIVLIQSSYYCGSGGCNLLVLDDDYTLITETTVTKPPIMVLSRAHLGFNDLSVYSDGEQRLLEYDGSTYPENPSLEPIYNINEDEFIIISEEDTDDTGKY